MKAISISKDTKFTLTLSAIALVFVGGWQANRLLASPPPKSESLPSAAVEANPTKKELIDWMIDVSTKLGGFDARLKALEDSNRELKAEVKRASWRNRRDSK